MIRILAVVERFPPVLGSDRRIAELVRRLPPEFEVTFLTVPPVAGPADIRGIPRSENARVIRLPKTGGQGIPFAPLHVLSSVARSAIGRYGRNFDAVLVDHPSPTSGLVGLTISLMASKPLLVDFCDDIAQYAADLLGLESRTAVWLLRFIQRLILNQSAGGTLATNYLRFEIPRSSRDKRWIVVPNGVEPSLYGAAVTRENGRTSFRVVYAGRYEGWAGSRLVERIAREIAQRGLKAEVVVAGTWVDGSASGPVRFVGMLPPEDVPRFLSESDAILVPFPPGKTSDAASPIKLFEAWASGAPTLASDVAGIREVARNGFDTLLLPPEDTIAWVDAIERLMREPARGQLLGRNARHSAEGATWASRARLFAESLSSLLADSRT